MIELNVTVELSHSKEHHYEEKSIWKKSLVFSLIAAMVLSLMPAEAFLTEVKADESYGNIVNSEDGVCGSLQSDHTLSDNTKPESLWKENDSRDGQVLPAVISRGTLADKDVFFEETNTSGGTEESDDVISFVTDDGRVLTKVTQDPRKGGYQKIPVDYDVPQADPTLSYKEARSLLVNDPNGDVKGSITNSYDFNIPEAYPASYDEEENLNDYLKNVLPPLRDQGYAGNCWAMSIMGLMENYMLANGLEDRNGKVSVKAADTLPGINYSELQLVYFYNRNNHFPNVEPQKGDYIEPREGYKLDNLGGHLLTAMGVMLNGIGAVDEALIPYSTYKNYTTDDQRHAVSGMDDEFMYHQDVVNLINAYYISIYDNVNQVKQAIMQNHAVGIGIVPGDGRKYYNAENNAQYNYVGDDGSGGHAVCIVGWDDSFPAENFSGKDGNGPIPRNNGAWLIRNSYTDTLGRDIDVLNYDGYFWLSYEDASIKEEAYVYEAGISDHDNNYSYNVVYNLGYGYINSETVANVFEIRGEKSAPKETVTAAVIRTPHADVDYSVSVYSVDENGYPLEPLNEATTGKIIYPGAYTIPLLDPVTLSRGEKFAIVVKTFGGYVSLEHDTDWGTCIVHAGKNEGESLLFKDGCWYDYSFDGYGNFMIQALTENEGLEENPDVTGMKISGRTEDSISVSWDAFPGAAYYYVFRSVGELEAYRDLSSYKPIALIPSASGATSYTDTKVPRNSHCVYYVVAADDMGSPISDKSRFVAAEPVAVYDPDLKVGKIYETTFGDSKYGLIGDANSGEDFIFQYKKQEDSEWTEAEFEIGIYYDSENDVYDRWWSFNKDLLEPGTYDFSITPYKINLYGERILGETFTDKFFSHYPAPTNVTGRYSTIDKTLTVSWDPVEGAPGYVVLNAEIDDWDNFHYCAFADAGTCSVTISELEFNEGTETIQDNHLYKLGIYVYVDNLEQQGFDPTFYALGKRLSFATYLIPNKFTVEADECVYDGNEHPVTVLPRSNIPEGDIGEITVFYAKVEGVVNSADSEEDGEGYEELIFSEWSEDAPKDAGIYVFALDVEDGAGYLGAEKLTDDSWYFEIEKADIVVTPDDGQTKEEDDEDIITYSWSPAAGSEEAGFTGSLSREEGETAGEYEINIGTLELADNGDFKADNYNLKFTEGGIFTITPVVALDKLSVSAEATPTTISLSWEAVPKANGYAIFFGDDAEPLCTTTRLSYKMTELDPDTEYTFVIYPYRSDDIIQYSDSSATVNVKTAAPGTLSPDNFKFSAEPAVYDKTGHGATVVSNYLGTEIGDITVYYRKIESDITGSASGGDTGSGVWTETVPVEAGTYEVAIDVATAIEYQGAEKLTDALWSYVIEQKEVGLEWSVDSFVYDESVQVPSVTLTGVLEGDSCAASVSGEATAAGTYTATVTGLSNTNYKLPEKTSVTFVIDKGDRTAPGAPEVEKILATSITLKLVVGYEYRMDEGEWQTDSVFSGLEQGKEYSFCQRIAGDENHNDSEASPAKKASTKIHEHEWEFSAEGAVITAVCKNTDGGHSGNTGSAAGTGNGNTGNTESSENTEKVMIIKPQHEVYGDGKPENATIEGSIDGVEIPEIIYMKGDEVLTKAPVASGTYKACIVIENGTAETVTASVDYTIEKADPVIKTVPVAKTELVFTNLKQELITAGAAEGGTILYALGSGTSDPGEDSYSNAVPGAVNAGIYTVFYKVKGDENHNDTKPDKLVAIISDRSSSTTGSSVVYVYVDSGNNTGSSGTASGNTSGNTSTGTSSENVSTGTSSGSGSSGSKVSSGSGAGTGSGKNDDKKDDESPKVTKFTDKNKDGSTVETVVTEYADGLKETEIVKKNKNGKETEKSFTSESVTKKGTKITNSVQHLADGTVKVSMIKEYKSGKKDIEIYEYLSEETVSYFHQILSPNGSMTSLSALMDTDDNAFITTTEIKKDGTAVVKKYDAKLYAGEDEDSAVPGSAKLVDYITSTKTVKVPKLIKENSLVLKIIAISKELFAGNEKITKAVIGANISVIEERAFYNADKLKKVYIYSQVLSDIGENAFAGIAKKATFYIKAKDKDAFNSIVGMIKNSGVGKKVRFKWIKK